MNAPQSPTEVSVDRSRLSLGVFHTICLSAITLIPVFRGTVGHPAVWAMPVIIANLLVAVTLTAPLMGSHPSPRWKSLWFLWLLIAYEVVSIIVQRVSLTDQQFDYVRMSHVLSLRLSTLDVWISIGCLVAITALLRSSLTLNFRGTGWRLRAAALVFILLARWNEQLLFIPSYVLIGIGCYVAFASLGRKWMWRSILVTVCVASIPCLLVIMSFYSNCAENQVTSLLASFRECSGVLPGMAPSTSSLWLIWLPSITLGIALSCGRWSRRTMIVAMGLQILAILATGRRSAFCTLLVMVPVALILSRRLKLRSALLGAGAVLALVAISAIASGAVRFLSFPHYGNLPHVATHLAALDMFRREPLAGGGFGMMNAQNVEWGVRRNGDLGWSLSAHNDYLDMLAEGGLIGFALAMGASLQLVMAGFRLLSKETKQQTRLLATAFLTQAIGIALCYSILMGVCINPTCYVFPVSAIAAAFLGAVWTEESKDLNAGVIDEGATHPESSVETRV